MVYTGATNLGGSFIHSILGRRGRDIVPTTTKSSVGFFSCLAFSMSLCCCSIRLEGSHSVTLLLGSHSVTLLLGSHNATLLLGSHNVTLLLGSHSVTLLLGSHNVTLLLGSHNVTLLLGSHSVTLSPTHYMYQPLY